MPSANKFRHQTYPAQPRLTPRLKSLQCAEFNHGHFADLHNTLLVGRVVLVHGTFVGDDPLGVSETLKSLGQGVPLIGPQLERLASAIQENTRPATASVIQDLGNYTDAYREKFQNLVGDDPQVELLTPPWSSQNHHLARADLAVRLVHQILQNPLPDDQRTSDRDRISPDRGRISPQIRSSAWTLRPSPRFIRASSLRAMQARRCCW